MSTHTLSKQETEKIIEKLNSQFGINEIPGKLIKTGKEKIFLYTGDLNQKEINKIIEIARIEGIGLYIAKQEENREEIRLTLEGAHIFEKQITKNTVEVDEEQASIWMHGNEILFSDIEKDSKEKLNSRDSKEWVAGELAAGQFNKIPSEFNRPKGYVIIKHKNDFLGTGKASEEKITNFIPKSRRLKERK